MVKRVLQDTHINCLTPCKNRRNSSCAYASSKPGKTLITLPLNQVKTFAVQSSYFQAQWNFRFEIIYFVQEIFSQKRGLTRKLIVNKKAFQSNTNHLLSWRSGIGGARGSWMVRSPWGQGLPLWRGGVRLAGVGVLNSKQTHVWSSHGTPAPEQTDRHDWKHYLLATSLAGGNKMHVSDLSHSIKLCDRRGEATTQRSGRK